MAAALLALPSLMKLATNPAVWVGVVGLGMAAAIGVQTMRLDHAKADQIDPATHVAWKIEEQADHPALVMARADLGRCQTNEGADRAALATQGAAVAALTATGAKHTAAANQALVAVRAQAATLAQRLAAVQAAKAGSDACASADKLILGSIAP